MLKKTTSIILPYDIQDSWNQVTSCKHFFKCDGLNSSGNLVDIKGDVVCAPQDGYVFEHDTTLNAVRSTAIGTAARKELVSGSFTSITEGKLALFFTAGYLHYVGSGTKAIRTAIGDTSSEGTGGWGMSDGAAGSGFVAHSLLTSGQSNGSVVNEPTTRSLGEEIENAVGTSGYFFRYAVYRADGNFQECKTYNGTTGVLIKANDAIYGGVADFNGDIPIDSKFRMHGYKSTGIALFLFDSIPADYLTAMIWMSYQWKLGRRVIWPYWP